MINAASSCVPMFYRPERFIMRSYDVLKAMLTRILTVAIPISIPEIFQCLILEKEVYGAPTD